MTWEELPAVEKGKLHIGCLSCSTASYELDMSRGARILLTLSEIQG